MSNIIHESVRGTKGGKDRKAILPNSIQQELQEQIDYVAALHEEDIREGFGEVYIPEALSRKYPNASKETGWQYVFPAKEMSKDPRTDKIMRHHVMESGLQKAVKQALSQTKIQKLMGHADVKTTEIYTHVMKKDIDSVKSPLDTL